MGYAMYVWERIKYQRRLLAQFIKRDLKARFAGTIGGALWLILNPLSQILIYFFLFSMVLRVQIPKAEEGTDSFVLFFLSGLFPWMAFNEAVMRSATILLENANLITKVVFPSGLLPLSVLASSFIIGGAGFMVLLIYLALKGLFSIWWCLLPLHFLLLMGFSLGLCVLISALTVFLRDLQQLLSIGLMVWFYATPIIYPISLVPERIRWIVAENPMYIYIALVREALFLSRQDPVLWVKGIIWCGISVFAGITIFRRLKPSFADVL